MRHFRRPGYSVALLVIMLCTQVAAQLPTAPTQSPKGTDSQGSKAKEDIQNLVDDLNIDLDLKLDEAPLSNEEQEVAELITQRVSSTEWLGALTPVALSPFFWPHLSFGNCDPR